MSFLKVLSYSTGCDVTAEAEFYYCKVALAEV